MGCVFFYACANHLGIEISKIKIIETIQRVESKILNQGPAGYQDYYPSLFGGVLSLGSKMSGVMVEQLYTPELSNYLEENMSLVYSGESRQSGINNWEVYKSFFDKNNDVVEGLSLIRDAALRGLGHLEKADYPSFVEEIAVEGEIRERLFSGILTLKMKELKEMLRKELKSFKGIKVCGAGGGGCFLIISNEKSATKKVVENFGMTILPFEIMPPVGKLND
jgi:D-glycero-alpha-D-manno-heptose-7-phosphate kinase